MCWLKQTCLTASRHANLNSHELLSTTYQIGLAWSSVGLPLHMLSAKEEHNPEGVTLPAPKQHLRRLVATAETLQATRGYDLEMWRVDLSFEPPYDSPHLQRNLSWRAGPPDPPSLKTYFLLSATSWAPRLPFLVRYGQYVETVDCHSRPRRNLPPEHHRKAHALGLIIWNLVSRKPANLTTECRKHRLRIDRHAVRVFDPKVRLWFERRHLTDKPLAQFPAASR